jgi:hypothetical protein
MRTPAGSARRVRASKRARVWLVHWDAREARMRARELRDAGYAAILDAQWNSPALRRLKDEPPAAVIIDLSRIPSRGRDVGAAIRSRAALLAAPILLTGGVPEQVERMRAIVPDAIATSWERLGAALPRAIANPPKGAVRQSVFAAYAATPLWKKLGIKEHAVVALSGAPANFERTLATLPAGAQLRRDSRGGRSLTLWFARTKAEVARKLATMAPHAEGGSLWIIWPKQGSGISSDLTDRIVRAAAAGAGLVDFKVSRIDETWAGLRFTRRR